MITVWVFSMSTASDTSCLIVQVATNLHELMIVSEISTERESKKLAPSSGFVEKGTSFAQFSHDLLLILCCVSVSVDLSEPADERKSKRRYNDVILS